MEMLITKSGLEWPSLTTSQMFTFTVLTSCCAWLAYSCWATYQRRLSLQHHFIIVWYYISRGRYLAPREYAVSSVPTGPSLLRGLCSTRHFITICNTSRELLITRITVLLRCLQTKRCRSGRKTFISISRRWKTDAKLFSSTLNKFNMQSLGKICDHDSTTVTPSTHADAQLHTDNDLLHVESRRNGVVNVSIQKMEECWG